MTNPKEQMLMNWYLAKEKREGLALPTTKNIYFNGLVGRLSANILVDGEASPRCISLSYVQFLIQQKQFLITDELPGSRVAGILDKPEEIYNFITIDRYKGKQPTYGY